MTDVTTIVAGELLYIRQHEEWSQIAFIPIAKILKGQSNECHLKSPKIFEKYDMTSIKTSESDNMWVAAFPPYPGSEEHYPTMKAGTRLGNEEEIVVGVIDLDLPSTKIRKLPIANTTGFHFGTGDGLDLATLEKCCPPFMCINTRLEGFGYVENDSDSNGDGPVPDLPGNGDGQEPDLPEDRLSAEISDLQGRLRNATEIAEKAESSTEEALGKLAATEANQSQKDKDHQSFTDELRSEIVGLRGSLMQKESDVSDLLDRAETASDLLDRAEDLSAQNQSLTRTEKESRNLLGEEKLAYDKLLSDSKNAAIVAEKELRKVLQHAEDEARTTARLFHSELAGQEQTSAELVKELDSSVIREMSAIEDTIVSTREAEVAQSEIDDLQRRSQNDRELFDEELRSAVTEKHDLASEVSTVLDRENDLETQLRQAQLEAEASIEEERNKVDTNLQTLEAALTAARQRLEEGSEAENNFRLDEIESKKKLSRELSASRKELNSVTESRNTARSDLVIAETKVESAQFALSERTEKYRNNLQRLEHTLAQEAQINQTRADDMRAGLINEGEGKLAALRLEHGKEVSQFQDEIAKLKSDEQKKVELIDALNAQLVEAKDTADNTAANLAQAEAKVSSLDGKYRELEEEAKGLTEKVDSLTFELTTAKELNVTLSTEMGDTGAAAVKMTDRLERTIKDQTIELDRLRLRVTTAEANLIKANDDYSKLEEASKDESAALAKKLSEAEKRADAMFVNFSASQDQGKVLDESLQDAQARITAQQLDIGNLTGALERAREDLHGLEEVKKNLDREHDSFKEQIRNWKGQYESVVKDLAQEKQFVKSQEVLVEQKVLVISEQEKFIQELKQQESLHGDTSAELRRKLIESQEKLAELQNSLGSEWVPEADLSKAESRVESLETSLATSDAALKISQDQNSNLKTQIEDLTSRLEEEQNNFLSLSARSAERDAELAAAEFRCGDLEQENMFLKSSMYQDASPETEGPPEGPAAGEHDRAGAGALEEPLPKSNPETFAHSQEGTPGRVAQVVEQLSPVAPPPDPAIPGGAGGGGNGWGGNGGPGPPPGGPPGPPGGGGPGGDEFMRAFTGAASALEKAANALTQKGGSGPPDPPFDGGGGGGGSGPIPVGMHELKGPAFDGLPKLTLPEHKSRPKLNPKPGEPQKQLRRDPCLTQWVVFMWLMKCRMHIKQSYSEYGGGWLDAAYAIAEEAGHKAYLRQKQTLDLEINLGQRTGTLQDALKRTATSLGASVVEERSEGPSGVYSSGNPKVDYANRRLDNIMAPFLFNALPVEIQQKIRGIYKDTYNSQDILYCILLAIWKNTEEERHDAQLEITTEFKRLKGESYEEVSDRFKYYVVFVHTNTSIRFPIKASMKAFHDVFEDRLLGLSRSIKQRFDLTRMNYQVDEWSEERNGSGSATELCSWVDVVMGFIKQEPQPEDVKAEETNYEKPVALTAAAAQQQQQQQQQQRQQQQQKNNPGGGATGGAGAQQPHSGQDGKPRDYSKMTCWRCQEIGHPYWECVKVINGVAGQGAGGPVWTPPPGKGKDSSTKGDKGSKGKGKGDQPGKGKGDSGSNQLRWKPKDKFLETLTADGKAKYIEYLKGITCQACGKKGHGAIDCPTHPPTQEQINQAFSAPKGAGKGKDKLRDFNPPGLGKGANLGQVTDPGAGGRPPPAQPAAGEDQQDQPQKLSKSAIAKQKLNNKMSEMFKAGVRAGATSAAALQPPSQPAQAPQAQSVADAKAEAQRKLDRQAQSAQAKAQDQAANATSNPGMSMFEAVMKEFGPDGARLGNAALSPREFEEVMMALSAFLRNPGDRRSKGPSIADSGATDGYFWKPRGIILGEDEINITNGLRTILEIFNTRELKVDGPQLTPVGKCCRHRCSSYIHVAGEDAPMMGDLSPEHEKIIRDIVHQYTPLETHNDIPIISESQTELLRDRLIKARGTLSPAEFRKQKQSSQAAARKIGVAENASVKTCFVSLGSQSDDPDHQALQGDVPEDQTLYESVMQEFGPDGARAVHVGLPSSGAEVQDTPQQGVPPAADEAEVQHQAEGEEETPPNFDEALRTGLLRDRRRDQEMQFDRAAEIVSHALGFHPAFLDRPVSHPMLPDPDGPVVANMAFVDVAAAANYPRHEAFEPPPRVTDVGSSSSEESERPATHPEANTLPRERTQAEIEDGVYRNEQNENMCEYCGERVDELDICGCDEMDVEERREREEARFQKMRARVETPVLEEPNDFYREMTGDNRMQGRRVPRDSPLATARERIEKGKKGGGHNPPPGPKGRSQEVLPGQEPWCCQGCGDDPAEAPDVRFIIHSCKKCHALDRKGKKGGGHHPPADSPDQVSQSPRLEAEAGQGSGKPQERLSYPTSQRSRSAGEGSGDGSGDPFSGSDSDDYRARPSEEEDEGDVEVYEDDASDLYRRMIDGDRSIVPPDHARPGFPRWGEKDGGKGDGVNRPFNPADQPGREDPYPHGHPYRYVDPSAPRQTVEQVMHSVPYHPHPDPFAPPRRKQIRAAAIAVDRTTKKGLFLFWKSRKWTVPSGSIEPGDWGDLLYACRRELREESGIPEDITFDVVYTMKHEDVNAHGEPRETTYYVLMRDDLEAEYYRHDWFAQRSEDDHEKIDRAEFFSITDPRIYPIFFNVSHVLGTLRLEVPEVFGLPPVAPATKGGGGFGKKGKEKFGPHEALPPRPPLRDAGKGGGKGRPPDLADRSVKGGSGKKGDKSYQNPFKGWPKGGGKRKGHSLIDVEASSPRLESDPSHEAGNPGDGDSEGESEEGATSVARAASPEGSTHTSLERSDEPPEEESGFPLENRQDQKSPAAPKKRIQPSEMSGKGIRIRAEQTSRIFPPPRPDGSYPERKMTVPAGNDRVTYEQMYSPTSMVVQFEQLDMTQRFDEMMAMLKYHSTSAALRTHMSMTSDDIVWNIKEYEGYKEWVAQGRPVSIIPTTQAEGEYLKHWGLSTHEALETGMIEKATEHFTIHRRPETRDQRFGRLSESQKGGGSKGGKPKGYLQDLLKSRPREGTTSNPEPPKTVEVEDSKGQSAADAQPGPYETREDRLRRLLGPRAEIETKGLKPKDLFDDLLSTRPTEGTISDLESVKALDSTVKPLTTGVARGRNALNLEPPRSEQPPHFRLSLPVPQDKHSDSEEERGESAAGDVEAVPPRKEEEPNPQAGAPPAEETDDDMPPLEYDGEDSDPDSSDEDEITDLKAVPHKTTENDSVRVESPWTERVTTSTLTEEEQDEGSFESDFRMYFDPSSWGSANQDDSIPQESPETTHLWNSEEVEEFRLQTQRLLQSAHTADLQKKKGEKGVGLQWDADQHVMADCLPSKSRNKKTKGIVGKARGAAGKFVGSIARWGMFLACLAGFAESTADPKEYAQAAAAFSNKGKPKIYDLRFLPPEMAVTVDKLDTLGWTHMMTQREQMYEAVPWGHEVHPFGTQLHGGWSNRRLTVLYHLNSEGVWTAVNKSYSTDFSRNKIVSRRFPYLVVTLFRRREMQQDVLGPAPLGEAPGDTYGCEYFDIASGEDPPDLDTSIEDVYGDMVFMSRSTESYWESMLGPRASDPVPGSQRKDFTYAFVGDHDDQVSEKDLKDLIGRWRDVDDVRASAENKLPEGLRILDEAANDVSKVLYKELSSWAVCTEKDCERCGEPFVVWEAIDVEEEAKGTRKQQKRERRAAVAHKMRSPKVFLKRVHTNATRPERGTEGAAGFDLSISQNVTIPARGKALLPTGWEMSIPEGWYGKIHARSGVSHKKHTDVGAGVIDSDYRGEVSVLMFNHSNKSLTFCTGDKVAQITFQEAHAPDMVETDQLDSTVRGKRGFGSTDLPPVQQKMEGSFRSDFDRSANAGAVDSSTQTVKPERAKSDPNMYRLKQRPCDYIRTSHSDGFHPSDGNASTCVTCCKTSLRAKNRSTTGRQEHRIRINIGGFSVDLMSRLTDLSIWQTSMVLTSNKLGKGSRPVVVALKMKSKTAKEIKITLLRCIAIAEYIWLTQPVSRIHSDQEPGLVKEPSWLFRAGITLTMTEGYSSKDNPTGENGVQNVAKMARASVLPMADLPETLKAFLFPYAVEFSAAYISAFNAQADDRDARLKVKDLAPFGCKVLYKLGPSLKLNADEDQAQYGWYLGPDMFVKHGSLILTNSSPHKVITATTVKMVTNDDKPIYPTKDDKLEVPVEQRGRPRKAEKDKIRREKSERGPGRPRKDGQPPRKSGSRPAAASVAYPAMMGDDFSVAMAGLSRDDQPSFGHSAEDFTEDPTPSILCNRGWNLDDHRECSNITGKMMYTVKGSLDDRPPGKKRFVIPGQEKKFFKKSSFEEITTDPVTGEQTLNVYFSKGTLEDTVVSLDSKAYSSYLPEGGFTEDQLKDVERQCSEDYSNSLELDMEWDIIDKDGTQLPPLDDFFPEHSVAVLGQRPSTAEEKFKKWSMNASRRDEHPLIEIATKHAHITRVIPIAEAKKRPGYREAMDKEMSRFLEYSAYGKPIPWSSIPPGARIYRGKPIYGVKFWELPADQQKDKARVVVQGCLQIKKHGGVVLDKLTRKRGEYWCPVGSMADLRLVCSVSAIQELNDETTDLSNGYLQTPTETPSLMIDLAQELQETLPDEWQKLIKEAKEEDIRMGGTGRCVFPALKNLYGESYAGTSFVYQYQRGFELAGWKRCRTSPALFYKRCSVSGKLQVLVSYVDDIAAAMSPVDPDNLWDNLRKQGWIFSEQGQLKRFVGINIHRINSRQFHLEQKEYSEQVVSKFEERHKDEFPNGIRGRRTVPNVPPTPSDEPREFDGARTDIGGIAYAARGTRPDICHACNRLAACANRWSQSATEFRDAVMAYIKGTSGYRLNIDARGMPRELESYNVCAWGDADYHAPKCHAGALIALRPNSSAQKAGELTRTLPWDWSSSTNRYSKLNTTESEIVALGLVSRAAIEHSTTWVELLTEGVDYMLTVGYERLDGGELEPYEIVYVYEDNVPCRLACERGWSSKMISMPRTYGVSLCWIYERIQQGLLKLVDERTTHMVADVFTKMVKATVLFDAKILIDFKEEKDTGGGVDHTAGFSANVAHAAANTSSPVTVDFHQLSDGSLEVKMILPKHLWSDPKFVGTLKEGIIDSEGRLLLSQ